MNPDEIFEDIGPDGTPDPLGHITDGRCCWCNPRIEQLCPACRDDEAMKAACGRCGGEGWVAQFTEDPEWPSIIIHSDVLIAALN